MASTNDKGHHGVVLNIVFDAHLEKELYETIVFNFFLKDPEGSD